MKTTAGIATLVAVGAGVVGVRAVTLSGSDTLEDLTIRLLTSSVLECGGVGEPTSDGVPGTLVYDGWSSAVGQASMIAGTQDVAPMGVRMDTSVCSAGVGVAKGYVFALDDVTIVARDTTAANSAGVCNGSQVNCNVDSPGKGLRFTFAGDPGAPPPALVSCTSAEIVDWRDVLRILYFGFDATTIGSASAATQACNSPCRNELANGYAKLFQSACTVGNSCTQVRHVFRRNDDSDTTELFRASLNLPAINHKSNFTPFCNNGTNGPAMNPVPTLTTCVLGCSAAGAPGTGFCDANSASPTFNLCTKQTCNTSADCPTISGTTHAPCGPTATAPLAAANVCQLEPITAVQVNVANHNLQNCLADADCPGAVAGSCDLKTSQCLCSGPSAATSCPPGSTCTAGAAIDGTTSACVPATSATPEPAHIIETTTAYGPAGSFVDIQDADPIRRTCAFGGGSPLEDVCNRDGKLGLVLSIWDATTIGSTTPNVLAVTAADAFPPQACDNGRFTCYPATRFALDAAGNAIYDLCPDGSNPNLPPAISPNVCPQGQCARPYHLNGTTQDPRCISSRSNLPPPLTIPPNDARVYNLTVWQQLSSGPIVVARYPRSTGQTASTLFGARGFVSMTGAFFRIHQNTPTISGSPACQGPSDTDQIGCLVRASWCSIGYTVNSAVNGATTSINVNNVTPQDPTCTQNLVTLASGDPRTYRLASRLYFNAARGFAAIDPSLHPGETNDQKNEFKLAGCYGPDDDGPSGPHGSAAVIGTTSGVGLGFVPVPGGPVCDDVALNVCGQPHACP